MGKQPRKKKILVVEDSVSIRESVKLILERNGYTPVEAVDGVDALNKIKEHSFECVITDINMPNMNGLELIGKARDTEECRYVPIIVLTSESQVSMLKKGMKAGATGWIVKPFNEEKLLATLNKVLN